MDLHLKAATPTKRRLHTFPLGKSFPIPPRLPLAVLLFLIGGCGPSPNPSTEGTKDTQTVSANPGDALVGSEIVIGSWGPQTGPAALWGSVNRGSDTFFKMINEEGGIHGRKIRFEYRDDGYQPQRTKAVVKELVERHQAFALVGGVGTAPGLAVKDYILEQGIPWVSPSSGSSHWAFPPHKTIFATYPLYCDEAAILTDYAVDQLKHQKIGFFYQNDDYGKGGLYGAQLALEKRGMALAATVSAEVGDTDLTSQIMALREAGVEAVILWLLPKQAQILLTNAAKLGFTPQWMTSSTLADAKLMYELTQGQWKGLIYTNFILLDDQDPTIQKYKAAQQKYAPKEHWGPFYASGFFYAEPLAEALRRCGPELTRNKLLHELENLNGYAGTGSPLHFGPDNRQGRRSVRLYQCQGPNESVSLSDWLTSDVDVAEAIRRLKQGT